MIGTLRHEHWRRCLLPLFTFRSVCLDCGLCGLLLFVFGLPVCSPFFVFPYVVELFLIFFCLFSALCIP